MIIWCVVEASAFFFLPAWWAWVILAIGVLVALRQSVDEDMKAYRHLESESTKSD
jgi:hypothetical protein